MPDLDWKQRAKATLSTHRICCRNDGKWTVKRTADKLHRSVGSVSEDIFVATYMLTFAQMETLDTLQDALEFARSAKKKMNLGLMPLRKEVSN